MLTKALSTDIKDLSEADGVVVAYANVYNNEDSDGDISAPGSFTKTVKENYKRIRVLKDHNPRESLGVPLEIDPSDSYGLKTKTQFNLQKPLAKDMFTDIMLYLKHGQHAELSIGFGGVVRGNKSDNRVITEYGWLGEYSFLTSWAANEKAIALDVKSKTIEEAVPSVISFLIKMYNLPYSDVRLKQIETILQTLDKQPDESTTAADAIAQIKSFTNLSF